MDRKQFCQGLLKLELHAHLNGSISESTIDKLIAHKLTKIPKWESKGNWRVENNVKRTMDQIFVMFDVIHEVCDDTHAIDMVTRDVIEEFANDNVKYLELRTTPRACESTGMTKESYIHTVIKAIRETSSKLDIIVKLLLSINRRVTESDAWETLSLAEKMRDQHADIIVGLDLSGHPCVGDATIYIPVFKSAKEKGFKLSLHLGEAVDHNEESLKLLELPPDRIGHGIFLHPAHGGNQQILKSMVDNKIPIEMCLTSNVCGDYYHSYEDHHYKEWKELKQPIVICTDDKGVFSTTLSNEYEILGATFNFTNEDLYQLSYQSIDYIFASESVKTSLRQQWMESKSF